MAESRTVKSDEPGSAKPPRPPEGMAGLAKGLAIIEAFETAGCSAINDPTGNLILTIAGVADA